MKSKTPFSDKITELIREQEERGRVVSLVGRPVRQTHIEYWMYVEEQDGTLIFSVSHEGKIVYAQDYGPRLESSAAQVDEGMKAVLMSFKTMLDVISELRSRAAFACATLKDAPENYSVDARHTLTHDLENFVESYSPSTIILPPTGS